MGEALLPVLKEVSMPAKGPFRLSFVIVNDDNKRRRITCEMSRKPH
eukprot:gene15138-18311_t